MNTDVKTGKHYAQGVSNVSELLSKILKEISLCLRAFVREMVLTVLHKCVQNEGERCPEWGGQLKMENEKWKMKNARR